MLGKCWGNSLTRCWGSGVKYGESPQQYVGEIHQQKLGNVLGKFTNMHVGDFPQHPCTQSQSCQGNLRSTPSARQVETAIQCHEGTLDDTRQSISLIRLDK